MRGLEFKLYTKEEIAQLSIEELLAYLLSSLTEIDSFRIKEFPLDEETLGDYYTIDFDQIKSHLKYSEDYSVLEFPIVDDREERSVFSKSIKDYFTPIGFFNFTKCTYKQKPLGLVDINMFIYSMERKLNALKHPHYQKVFEKEENLAFDFENNKYVRADKENPNNEHSQIYKERLELLHFCLGKVKKYYFKTYFPVFLSFIHESRPDGQYQHAVEYVEQYKNYLENYFENGVSCLLIFSDISVGEYMKLKLHAKSLLKILNHIEDSLKKVKKEEDFSFADYVQLKHTEEYQIYEEMRNLINHLENFKTPRKNQQNKTFEWGYIGINRETKELFPNIAEVERRRYFTEDHWDEIKEDQIRKEYYEFQLNKETNKETEETTEVVSVEEVVQQDEIISKKYPFLRKQHLEELKELNLGDKKLYIGNLCKDNGIDKNVYLELMNNVHRIKEIL